ncbi:MAG: hypothetical protein VKN83_02185 [Cyanobacteriota bacterium]|jgi:hypothetical protein|nr:hypothetical protein [Cyanobacteriota bacterium]
MSAGNRLPPKTWSAQSQPGQRALRLVDGPSPTLQRLQRDLEAARAEAHSLHELLEQLPAILERKFQLRLAALLAEQRQLQHDNALLQHHLLALHGGAQPPRLEPAAPALPPAPAAPAPERPLTQGLGLRRALRHVHLSGAAPTRGGWAGPTHR